MHTNIVTSSKRTRVQNAAAAGVSSLNTTILDMQGFEAVLWEALFGTLTAGQVTSIKAQAGNVANGSDMNDLAGASAGPMADADSNKALVLEVFKPTNFRYVRLVVVRGTQNAVVDGVIATQYHSRKQPESDDATTVSATTLSIDPLYADTAKTVTTTIYTGTTTKVTSTARNSS